MAVQPHCLYQRDSRYTIQEWGITQITPGRQPAQWNQHTKHGDLRCVALVGCTVHQAHGAAPAAIAAHDGVQRVAALVHVHGGSKEPPQWRPCCKLSAARKLALTGTTLQSAV